MLSVNEVSGPESCFSDLHGDLSFSVMGLLDKRSILLFYSLNRECRGLALAVAEQRTHMYIRAFHSDLVSMGGRVTCEFEPPSCVTFGTMRDVKRNMPLQGMFYYLMHLPEPLFCDLRARTLEVAPPYFFDDPFCLIQGVRLGSKAKVALLERSPPSLKRAERFLRQSAYCLLESRFYLAAIQTAGELYNRGQRQTLFRAILIQMQDDFDVRTIESGLARVDFNSANSRKDQALRSQIFAKFAQILITQRQLVDAERVVSKIYFPDLQLFMNTRVIQALIQEKELLSACRLIEERENNPVPRRILRAFIHALARENDHCAAEQFASFIVNLSALHPLSPHPLIDRETLIIITDSFSKQLFYFFVETLIRRGDFVQVERFIRCRAPADPWIQSLLFQKFVSRSIAQDNLAGAERVALLLIGNREELFFRAAMIDSDLMRADLCLYAQSYTQEMQDAALHEIVKAFIARADFQEAERVACLIFNGPYANHCRELFEAACMRLPVAHRIIETAISLRSDGIKRREGSIQAIFKELVRRRDYAEAERIMTHHRIKIPLKFYVIKNSMRVREFLSGCFSG